MIRITLAALVAGCLTARAAGAAELTVIVTGVRNDAGSVEVCLWNKPAGFPDCVANAVQKKARQPSKPGQVVFRLGDVTPGTYAVSAFHDEKNTGRVETNFIGIPRVGVGASRDARGRLGPPSFEDAAVTVGTMPATVTFGLSYP